LGIEMPMKRIVLAPAIDPGLVRSYAQVLRDSQKRFATLLLLDLAGRQVRKPSLKHAQSANVRVMEIDSLIQADVLRNAAVAVFGETNFLYREVDDEDVDVCVPDAAWLGRTFKTDDLAWLLEPEEDPIPWNRTCFYVFPGNPAAWDVTVPIHAGLMTVARPGEPRACPSCGTTYTSKRQDMCQCPNRGCGFVAHPFASVPEAKSTVQVPLDAFAWGRCPRCRRAVGFVNQIEQCSRCGQLLRGTSNRHALELTDNSKQIARLVSDLFSDETDGEP
jgi:hypothetical protein